MNIFQSLYKTIKGIKDFFVSKSMPKSDLLKYISNVYQSASAIAMEYDKFSCSDLNNLYEKYQANEKMVLKELNVSKSLVKKLDDLPFVYKRTLKNEALLYDSQCFLNAVKVSLKNVTDMLNEAQNHIEKYLDGEQIEFGKLRMSSLAFMNLIAACDFYQEYAAVFLGYLLKVASSTEQVNLLKNFYKFRMEWLTENIQKFASLTNMICNKAGKFEFLRDIESVRKSGNDIIVSAVDYPWYKAIKITSYPKGFINILLDYVYFFRVFLIIGDLWQEYQHRKYLRNKEIKEWLEQHIALLKLRLNNIDPSDPKYQQLIKIIENYEQLLAKYDKKIQEYEKEAK